MATQKNLDREIALLVDRARSAVVAMEGMIATEVCDHDAGICWCQEHRAIESLNESLRAFPDKRTDSEKLAALEVENKRLREEKKRLRSWVEYFFNLVGDSHGLVGYHLNGDVAEWPEFQHELDEVALTLREIHDEPF